VDVTSRLAVASDQTPEMHGAVAVQSKMGRMQLAAVNDVLATI